MTLRSIMPRACIIGLAFWAAGCNPAAQTVPGGNDQDDLVLGAGGADADSSGTDTGGDPLDDGSDGDTPDTGSGGGSSDSGSGGSTDTPPATNGCSMFPADNIWNTPVDQLPVSAHSAAYIASIGSGGMHADFGSGLWEGGPIGIPYVVVDASQPKVSVTFDYDDESDAGPYPIPPDAPIEGGADSDGDRHILILESTNCVLYELFAAYPQGDGTWRAGSGAIYVLTSNALRPAGWTSADAAGLPILPGLVRYDEVAAGQINHAIRFTVQRTQKAYVWPARHHASSNTSTSVPPMGQRFRLRADFDVSSYPASVQVILNAMKKYGLILADNGSNWYISGVPDERWNNDELATFRNVRGSNFEAVDVSSLMVDPNSGQIAH
jgi:hypothetical protein